MSTTISAMLNSNIFSLLFFFFFFFIFSVFLSFGNSLSFNFPSFNESTPTLLDLQGDTFWNKDIQLTRNDINPLTLSTGRAVYRQPLLLWNSVTGKQTDFTTHFSFKITATFKFSECSAFCSGDGLAFFLSPFPYPPKLPNNSAGGCLGLFSNDTALDPSKNQLVAVEIDTYPNDYDPRPPAYHVGIDVNSINSSAHVDCNRTIISGQTSNATISYNSSAKNLSVVLMYNGIEYDPHRVNTLSFSHVVDLREILPEKVGIGFSSSTGLATELHEILSWDFSSNLEEEILRGESKVGLIVGLTVSVGVIMAVLGVVWFIYWRKKARRPEKPEEFDSDDESIDEEFEKERGPKRFTFNELASATTNFAREGKLGQGGFGEVYKGFLNDEQVAIKRVSAGSQQGKKEYLSEVRIISRLRHRNLVQLVGWCHKQHEFLLVYKFMPNGSLDSHLYSQDRFLPWTLRYKIALGLASALLYLHEEWEQCVVHRDIKPSNVMLDSEFEAKLGDFGLARLVDHEIGSQTTMLAGTMGYLAPESVTTGRARKESDVYSFGIVSLEIACGRKPVEFGRVKLVEWVWELYGRRMILEAADERLKMDFDEKEMERLTAVGLWCAHPDHVLRPSIREAIGVLKFEAPLPHLPPTMPVTAFVVPPFDVLSTLSVAGSAGISSVSSGYATNSSSTTQSSGSSSTSLLKSYRTEITEI